MKKMIYVIFDKAAEESAHIFECNNDAVAWRKFQHAIAEADDYATEDYQLLCLGTIDHVINHIEAYSISREVQPSVRLVEMDTEDPAI